MKLFRNKNFLKFLPVLGFVILTIAGCGSSSSTAFTASLRVINASANAPNIDVLNDGQGLLTNIPFTAGSPYIAVSPSHTQKLGVYAASTQFQTLLFPVVNVSTTSGSVNSVYAINDLDTITSLVVQDDTTPPAAGQANIRLLHLAPDVPGPNAEVDVYVTAAGLDLTTITPPLVADPVNGPIFVIGTEIPYAGIDAENGISPYIPLPAAAAGTKYQIQVFQTGTIGTPLTALINASVTLKPAQIRTILALDKAFPSTGVPTGTFQGVVLNDLN